MAAETGSGKTGAFCLPVLQIVWESLKDLQEGKANKQVCFVLSLFFCFKPALTEMSWKHHGQRMSTYLDST